jgi:hypothetical protein
MWGRFRSGKIPCWESDGTTRLTYRQGDNIFVQGDDADAVFYIEIGARIFRIGQALVRTERLLFLKRESMSPRLSPRALQDGTHAQNFVGFRHFGHPLLLQNNLKQ